VIPYRQKSRSLTELPEEFVMGLGLLSSAAPYVQSSFEASLIPAIDSLRSLAIVWIPGLMAGMLLSGARPGKMRRTGSARSNSCPRMIQRLGCLRLTSLGNLSGDAHLTDARSLALVAVAGAEKEDAGETVEANGTTATVGPVDGF
jgi:hypothetical protein